MTRHGDGARALVDKHELERWRVAEQDAAEARAAQRPSVPAALRAYVIARDASRCHLCGQKCRAGDIHLDHVIPYSLDGETTAANLRVSHSWCNLRKHTRASYEQLMVIG